MSKKEKIGIFGGCFNPPHKMHETIGLELIKKGYVDKVIYVPTNNAYQKPGLVSNEHRYNMLNILFQDNPNIIVSDFEFTKPTFTYETLAHYQSLHPESEIYFICGQDNINELNTWRNYEYILPHYKLLVINRNPNEYREVTTQYPEFQKNIILTTITPENISSTMIRNALAQKDHSNILLKNLKPQVLTYINQNNLYKE